MATYQQIQAKTVLRRSKQTDSWFISRFGMNLYRGCQHGCAYCDGRAEHYRVQGDFARQIQVKANAPALLAREIPRLRARGFLFIGGGVCDAYQPAEGRFRLARAALKQALVAGRPVHVLTKGALVRRDLDLLARIQDEAGALLSVSISTLDQGLADLLEPGCAPVADRLSLLAEAKQRGLGVGIMLMPLMPLLSDSAGQLDRALAAARAAGVDYVLCGGLTLKPGRQREHLYATLGRLDPGLPGRYARLYGAGRYGNARGDYYARLEGRFAAAARRHGVAPRVPHRLFRDRVPLNTEVALVLAHLSYLHQLRGRRRRAYEAAGRRIMATRERVDDLARAGMLGQIKGVGPVITRVVMELISRRRCQFYEEMLAWER